MIQRGPTWRHRNLNGRGNLRRRFSYDFSRILGVGHIGSHFGIILESLFDSFWYLVGGKRERPASPEASEVRDWLWDTISVHFGVRLGAALGPFWYPWRPQVSNMEDRGATQSAPDSTSTSEREPKTAPF